MGWLSRNWKTLVVLGVSTVVFVAVTLATGGLGAPAMLALAAGGFSSGVAGYATGQLLNGKPIQAGEAVKAGAIAGVVTVATMGLGRVVAPLISRAAPLAARAVPAAATTIVPNAVRSVVANGVIGGAVGGAFRAGDNVVHGKPWNEGLSDAVTTNAVNGALLGPLATRMLASSARPTTPEAPPPQPKSGGLVKLLDAEMAGGNKPGPSSPATPPPTRAPAVEQPATTPAPGPSRAGNAALGEELTPSIASRDTIGGTANKVYRVKLNDGTEHVVKGESTLARWTGKMFGISSQNKMEVAAYQLDEAMGLKMVPETKIAALEGKEVVQQAWMPGKSPRSLRGDPILESPAYKAQLADMKAFDYLIQNVDRHQGNWLVNPQTGKITLIDNGLSGATWRPFYRSGGRPSAVTADFAAKLDNLSSQALAGRLDGLMTQGEIDALLARAQDLRAGVQDGSIRVIR